MRKILLKILGTAFVLCLALTTLIGCSNSTNGYKPTSMNDWGEVIQQKTYIAETEKYIYFINGISPSTADNAYGKPIKGALMVADKNDLSKVEVAVPKLFTASDYTAGFYILGDYVYFGTPSTDKKADGSVANETLTFMKAKLDGSSYETFFTVGSTATEYRMTEVNGVVYITYYDTEESALMTYNTDTKEKITIAKTDEKLDQSLLAYKLLPNGKDTAVAVFTTLVYAEPYYQDKIDAGQSREAEDFNALYVYSIGDAKDEHGFRGVRVYDGATDQSIYSIGSITNDYLYFRQNTFSNKEYAYAIEVSDLITNPSTKIELTNATISTEATTVISPSEVYNLENGKIFLQSLTDKTIKQAVALVADYNEILFIHDNFIYYKDVDNVVYRIEMGNEDANRQRVSNGVVTSTWYKPQLVTIGDKTYVFYSDDTTKGCYYINYVDVDANVIEEDTDDNGEIDLYYLENSTMIGIMTDKDKATVFAIQLNELSNDLKDGALVYEEIDGVLTVAKVVEMRNAYDALPEAIRKEVSEDAVTLLTNYEKAIEKANIYNKLSAIRYYEELGEEERDALRDAFNQVKGQIEEFMKTEDYTTIRDLIGKDLLRHYQKAANQFKD